jgi:hydrogenase maturation factor
VVRAHAARGDVDRAKTLISTITGIGARYDALTGFIKAAAVGGRADQAEAAADYVMRNGNLHWRHQARIALAEAMVTIGDHDRAVRLATEPPVFDELVAVLAAVGDIDRAEALARTIPDDFDQSQTMWHVLGAAFVAGDIDRAEAIARSLAGDIYQEEALITLADAAVTIGLLDRADAIHRTLPKRSYSTAYMTMPLLTSMSTAATALGDLDKARALALRTEVVARAHLNHTLKEDLATLVQALVAVGEIDRAVSIAHVAADKPAGQAWMLATVAAAVAKVDADRATELATEAEGLARTTPDPQPGDNRGIATLTIALAKAGDLDRVEDLLDHSDIVRAWTKHTSLDPDPLIGVVTAMAEVGDVDRAEALARSVSGPEGDQAQLALVKTLGTSGLVDRAWAIAETFDNPEKQAEALLVLLDTLLANNDPEYARVLVYRIDAIARAVSDDDLHAAQTKVSAVDALVAVGGLDRAEQVARSIGRPYFRSWKLTTVARKLAVTGQLDRAQALLRLADPGDLLTPDSTGELTYPVAEIAGAMAAVGDFDRAEVLACSVDNRLTREFALTAVIKELVPSGHVDQATELAGSITDISERSWLQRELAEAIITTGDLDRAEALAPAIPFASDQGRVWIALVTALVASGDRAQARLVADRVVAIPDAKIGHLDKARQLKKLVRILAADFDWAKPVADLIAVPEQQAEALTALAEATPGQAADLLGRAFQVGYWAVPLAALIRTDPSVTPIIADEFRALSQLPTQAQLAWRGIWRRSRRRAPDSGRSRLNG